MKKLQILSIIVISLFSFSCKEYKNETSDFIISIDINAAKTIKIEDFISNIEIIPLDNKDTCILSPYIKLNVRHDTLYIYDNKQVAMFSFDPKGNFIADSRKLKGSGPEEIYHIGEVQINPFTENIEFISPFGQMLIADKNFNYKENTNYLKEKPITHLFSAITEDYYIFTTIGSKDNFVYSKSKNEIVSKISNPNHAIFGVESGGLGEFYHYNNTLYYTPNYFHNTIYKVTKDKIIPVIKFDFGDKNIPENDESAKFYPYFQTHQDKVFPSRKNETKDGFITFLSHDNQLFITTTSKKTKKTNVFKYKFRDGVQILPYHYIDDDYMYYLSDPTHLPYFLKKIAH